MRVWSLKQGGTSLENFYNTLYVLWREIDFRRPNEMSSPKDAKKYNEIAQQDRLHIFFGGLNNRLDNVRSEILRMRQFPSIEEVFGHVRREDVRQGIMVDKLGVSNNSMAMVAQGTYS
jgi:hypothetical protein